MIAPFEPPAAKTSSASGRSDSRDVVLGFFAVFGLHLAVGSVAGGVSYALWLIGLEGLSILPGLVVFGLPITQAVWVGWFIRWANQRGRPALAQGALIAAAVTFFLCAACAGLTLYLHANEHHTPV